MSCDVKMKNVHPEYTFRRRVSAQTRIRMASFRNKDLILHDARTRRLDAVTYISHRADSGFPNCLVHGYAWIFTSMADSAWLQLSTVNLKQSGRWSEYPLPVSTS